MRGQHRYRRSNWRCLRGSDTLPTRSALARLFTVKVHATEAIPWLTHMWHTLQLNTRSGVGSPEPRSFRIHNACVSSKEVW